MAINNKDIIFYTISFLLVILGFAILGGMVMVFLGKWDMAYFGLFAGAIFGIIYQMASNVVKIIDYIHKVICPYGIYPDCAPGKYAIEKGYKDELSEMRK